MRGTTEEALTMARTTVLRGVIQATDDSPKVQTVDVRLLHGQLVRGMERLQTAGHTSVALPIEQDGKGAEVVVVAPLGDVTQAIVVAVDDRRHRPKNLRPGESAGWDDQGQIHAIKRDGIVSVAKQHSITAGAEPETGEHELQSQLKGITAMLAQHHEHIAGLHYVTSQLREIAQGRIPELAALQTILDKTPAGLDAMASNVQALAQNYLQKQVQQALAKFTAPTISAVTSVLASGVEAATSGLKAQIANALAANPVVAAVDALQAELTALTSSGAAANIIQAGIGRLQPQIDAITAGNPIIAEVADLRNQLAAAVTAAGPGLNFLAPMQRVVQGLTKSMRIAP